MIKRLNTWLLLFGLVVILLGCAKKDVKQTRTEYLSNTEQPIEIAVTWPWKQSKAALGNGIDLAVQEINAKGGILNGRKLKIHRYDDEGSLTQGRLVAQEIANNPQIAAVIGHLNSHIAIPASHIYDRAGLLMITAGSSGQKLTENNLNLVFRGLAGNRDQGRQIGSYAAEQGYKNVAIYYIKNDYGADLANAFEQRAKELGMSIADRRSYDKSGDSYTQVLADWANFVKPDAIFLIGSLPESATIITEARRLGLNVPIFGGVGLDAIELIQQGGKAVEDTVVFALFNNQDPRSEVQKFVQVYQERYGELPDSAAAQGYDAVHLLSDAMVRTGNPLPAEVAETLRHTQGWQGVTGIFSFSKKGDLIDKSLAKVVVHQGKFRFFQKNPDEVKGKP